MPPTRSVPETSHEDTDKDRKDPFGEPSVLRADARDIEDRHDDHLPSVAGRLTASAPTDGYTVAPSL